MTIENKTKLSIILSALKPSEYRKFWKSWKNYGRYNADFIRNIQGTLDLFDLFVLLQYGEIDGATFKPYASKAIDYLQEHWDEFEEDFESNKAKLIEYVEGLLKESSEETSKIDLDNLYKDLFGGKFRIILPIKESINFVEFDEAAGRKFAYEFEGFAALLFLFLGKEDEYEAIEKHRETYRIVKGSAPNYLSSGMYQFYSDRRRKVSIGKIFQQIKDLGIYADLDIMDKYAFDDIVKQFDSRNIIKHTNDLIVVLSRHPYDIAGMSTNRGWTSCMNLHTDGMSSFVMSSLLTGALIAYLCRNSDSNIEHPLGRLLIKPAYREEDGKINLIKPNFILRCSKTYGTFPNIVITKVQHWLDTNWNRFIDTEDSAYRYDSENFYIEDFADKDIKGSSNKRR